MQGQGDRIGHPLLSGTRTPDRVDRVRDILRHTEGDRYTGSHPPMIH